MMDPTKMLEQIQAMKQRVDEKNTELAAQLVTASSGGDMVKITVTGKGEAKHVSIDPSLLSHDNKTMLEDLVIAAMNEATRKAKSIEDSAMQSIAGMSIPGLKI